MIAGLVAPADSARVAAAIYGVSLLSLAPVALAAAGALTLRHATAGTRFFVWRAAVIAVLLCVAGRLSPAHWTAWVLPSLIAAPLVELGRVQMAAVPELIRGGAGQGISWLSVALAVYCAGAIAVAVPFVAALGELRGIRRRAHRVDHTRDAWSEPVARARHRMACSRPLRVYVSSEVRVPATWGFVRPVIVLPVEASAWPPTQLELALAHEMGHVRSHDWIFGLLARAMCVVFWFNPAMWWLERRVSAERELACDERVLAAGAPRSEYAELLVRGAEALDRRRAPRGTAHGAFGLVARGGLRQRLHRVLETPPAPGPAAASRARGSLLCASVAIVVLAAPASMVRLAPTRGVLDSLMHDVRWQTRAYAVVGLAQRSDSLAVARSAAEGDPNPRVRAWARYALSASPNN
jgi:beta-lactamase regulating signal transducer with metallopeptidase domain